MNTTTTLGFTEAGQAGGAGRSDYLFLLVEGDRPGEESVCYRLDEVGLVVLGRGASRSSSIDRMDGTARLSICVPDSRTSRAHARLVRAMGEWVLEDAGSKNGTRVNGAPVSQHPLVDGDLIEVGKTFFLFRAKQPAHSVSPGVPGMATLSPQMGAELAKVVNVAESTLPIQLLGESGTGKEVLARAVHVLSKRKGAFIAVNCGALPAGLIESELFGHKKGAFSGALEDKPGLVRAAAGGTLFLDEIGDLPLASQTAFLRVLEERAVVPVGGTQPVPVDFRLVVATHRPLSAMVEAGRFRADLLARLSGLVVRLPPLSERREDLGVLIAALLGRSADERVRRAVFSAAALRALLLHDWPLNVRELGRCLEAAALLAGEGTIEVCHLPEALQGAGATPAAASASTAPVQPAPCEDNPPLSEHDRELRAQIEGLLREHQGNVSAVAREMGKARPQVQRWIRRLGLGRDSLD